MKITTILSIAVTAAVLTSCCCFEPEVSDATGTIIVREVTLAEFNSTMNGNTPDPRFSIAMFKFPGSVSSSGDLPNDSRFSNGMWTSATADYPARGLTSYYVFSTPPNKMLSGDFLAADVRSTLREADLRVRGKLYMLPANPALLSDDASTFANELRKFIASQQPPAGQTLCQMLDSKAIDFGTTVVADAIGYDSMYVKKSNGADTNIVYPTNWVTDSKGNLLPPIKSVDDVRTYEITLKPGDWFYYKAVNGMSFYVLVSNIQAGILPPYIDRITFKYAEAYGCPDCKK